MIAQQSIGILSPEASPNKFHRLARRILLCMIISNNRFSNKPSLPAVFRAKDLRVARPLRRHKLGALKMRRERCAWPPSNGTVFAHFLHENRDLPVAFLT